MSLTTDTSGLEPNVVCMGAEHFTVHYLHATKKQKPETPDWYAFSLVMYDAHGRPHPAERFSVPQDIQPPGIGGTGATHLEAYEDLKTKLLQLCLHNATNT